MIRWEEIERIHIKKNHNSEGYSPFPKEGQFCLSIVFSSQMSSISIRGEGEGRIFGVQDTKTGGRRWLGEGGGL